MGQEGEPILLLEIMAEQRLFSVAVEFFRDKNYKYTLQQNEIYSLF